jgi:uncharacterized protein
MNWQNKPILVAGIGLSIVLWIWESLQKSFLAIGEYAFLAIFLVGGGFWLLSSRRQIPSPKLSLPTNREDAIAEIDRVKKLVVTIEAEDSSRDINNLKQQIDNLLPSLDRVNLNISIIGTKKAGKTSLKNLLEGQNIDSCISFGEATIGNLPSSIGSTEESAIIADIVDRSDLVLYLCTGDITDSELKVIKQLHNSYQPQLSIFNKQDLYQTEERDYLIQNLQQRVKEIVDARDIIAIAAAPNPIKIIRQKSDSSETESLETALLDRLASIVTEEKQQLIWTTTWRQAIKLKQESKDVLNLIRRDRALPIIDRYQWIAAAAAFANPVAALDLLAAVAINAQMLVDLGNIYEQKITLDRAQNATKAIGKTIVKLGLVEITSQTIVGLLKTNTITYIAGGTIQGISAAYLTHVTGLSLVEYFQDKEIDAKANQSLNVDKFGQKLQQIFEQTKRTTFLQNLVKQSLIKLFPEMRSNAAS